MMSGTEKKITLVGLNARFVHSCLALFYVRNELEGHCGKQDISIFQGTINDNYYELLLKLSSQASDYIFFSAAIWNSDLVERLTIDLAKCLPSAKIVIGGPQASTLSRKLAESKNCTTVLGPIETADPEFFKDLLGGELQTSYKSSGENSAHGKSESLRFDSPYRAGDYQAHLENRNVYYETSRGCPFRCSYCLSAADTRVYHQPIDQVKAELGMILENNPKTVRFVDRTFNDLPKRTLAIWQHLVKAEAQTLFHFEMAPDRFSDEMIVFLQSVPLGKFQFEIGLQSTHGPTLEAIDRKMDLSAAHANISALAGYGNIHLHVDLILGLPFETEESFAQSFRDVYAMGAHYIQMGLLKILPDTPISLRAGEFGYVWQENPPYSVLANKWMSHQELNGLYWFCECVEKFLNNRYFPSFWGYLRSTKEDIYLFFTELLALGFENSLFERAPTQEFLCSLLVKSVAARDDSDLIVDLLCFDWLRCGFRYVPEFLQSVQNSGKQEEIRSRLYREMPSEVDGVFSASNRNFFFRKTYFQKFSDTALRQLGYDVSKGESCLCFLAEREESLFKFNKVVQLYGV